MQVQQSGGADLLPRPPLPLPLLLLLAPTSVRPAQTPSPLPPPSPIRSPASTACPKATRERADRVFAQRFFCVERLRREGETSEQFKVLGSTGNRYTVTVRPRPLPSLPASRTDELTVAVRPAPQIDELPSCDCPDGAKGNTCKHRLFVLLKVLQVPSSSNLWYQSALLSSELAAIFASARRGPRTAFEEGVVRRYQVATGVLKPEELEAESSALGVKKRIPDEGDSCPICCASLFLLIPPPSSSCFAQSLTEDTLQTRTIRLGPRRA